MFAEAGVPGSRLSIFESDTAGIRFACTRAFSLSALEAVMCSITTILCSATAMEMKERLVRAVCHRFILCNFARLGFGLDLQQTRLLLC
jgi:hypothetical protein